MHHFVAEMYTHVHISVTIWCIVRRGTGALWDCEFGLFRGNSLSSTCRSTIALLRYRPRHDDGGSFVFLDFVALEAGQHVIGLIHHLSDEKLQMTIHMTHDYGDSLDSCCSRIPKWLLNKPIIYGAWPLSKYAEWSSLTHRCQNKMVDILQTTYSNAFS